MNEHNHLHIFVNRRRFDSGDGVQEHMTGAAIAALIHIPADVAIIRRENPPHAGEIGPDEKITVRNGEHFLVTRRVVEGG